MPVEVPNSHASRSFGSAGVVGGVVYLAGGTTVSAASGTGLTVSDGVAFDPSEVSFLRAGSPPVAVSNAGAAVTDGRLYLIGGETSGGTLAADAQFVMPFRAFGLAGSPGAGSPYYGDDLLIADRGNNRLLLLNNSGRTIWSYPAEGLGAPPGDFYFSDAAFFIRHGTAIICNEEEDETIIGSPHPGC